MVAILEGSVQCIEIIWKINWNMLFVGLIRKGLKNHVKWFIYWNLLVAILVDQLWVEKKASKQAVLFDNAGSEYDSFTAGAGL